MTQEELNYIKDSFSQIIDDIAGNPDWYKAARAVALDLGTLERELGKKVASLPSNLDDAEFEYAQSLDGIPANLEEEKMIYDAFIAGTQWQAEHTEDYPMPEDTVLFNKGVEEGKRLMMEDAIEVPLYRDGDFFASIDIDMATLGYTDNDKVKIIIVKEGE